MAVDFLLCISTTAPVLTSPERLSTHLWNVAQTIFLKNCTVGHAPVHSTKRNGFSELDLFFVDQP